MPNEETKKDTEEIVSEQEKLENLLRKIVSEEISGIKKEMGEMKTFQKTVQDTMLNLEVKGAVKEKIKIIDEVI